MFKHLARRWVAMLGTATLALTGLAALTPSASAAAASQLGTITAVHRDGNMYVFDAGAAKLRVTVDHKDLLRVEAAGGGAVFRHQRREGADRRNG